MISPKDITSQSVRLQVPVNTKQSSSIESIIEYGAACVAGLAWACASNCSTLFSPQQTKANVTRNLRSHAFTIIKLVHSSLQIFDKLKRTCL